jgi:hypothetical protein
MSPVTRAFLFLGLKEDRTAKQVLSPFARGLKTGQVSATIDRLFESKHVYDLRLIAAVAFIVVVWITGIALVAAGLVVYANCAKTTLTGCHFAQAVIVGGPVFLKLFGPTIAVLFGVLTWAYQSGNARLGIVDLFACEIDTICRVITVTDMVKNEIKRYSHCRMGEISSSRAEISANHPFVSQENYFPILDSSVDELQKLEARVISHVAAFYTFIKTFRDSLRQLAELQLGQVDPQSVQEPHFPAAESMSRRQEASRNSLYALYLGLESGRKAILDLVEFEPDYTERAIVILISELTAYRFLREQFNTVGEMRHDRLVLRQVDYRGIVPALCKRVEDHKTAFSRLRPFGSPENLADEARQWCAAYQLLHELNTRYERVSKLPVECPAYEEVSRAGSELELEQ